MSLNHFEIANFLLSFMNPSLSLMLAPSARGQVFRLPDTSACQKSKSELWSKVSRCNHREISRILIQLNFTKFLKLFTISGQVHENRFGKAYHFSWKSAGWIEKSGSTNQWGFWEFRKLSDVHLVWRFLLNGKGAPIHEFYCDYIWAKVFHPFNVN